MARERNYAGAKDADGALSLDAIGADREPRWSEPERGEGHRAGPAIDHANLSQEREAMAPTGRRPTRSEPRPRSPSRRAARQCRRAGRAPHRWGTSSAARSRHPPSLSAANDRYAPSHVGTTSTPIDASAWAPSAAATLTWLRAAIASQPAVHSPAQTSALPRLPRSPSETEQTCQPGQPSFEKQTRGALGVSCSHHRSKLRTTSSTPRHSWLAPGSGSGSTCTAPADSSRSSDDELRSERRADRLPAR
jgi:hypothetical protein